MPDYTLLVNREYLLPANYVPKHLTEPKILFDAPKGHSKRLLEYQCAKDVQRLFRHAMLNGIVLYGVSGYRPFSRQKELYELAENQLYVAPPGASEHQTGLALDVSSPKISLELIEEFEKIPEGIWLHKNAHLFGFIIRYPKGREEITGYAYEPWHIRYVTKPLALYLHITGLTLEEYQRFSSIKEH